MKVDQDHFCCICMTDIRNEEKFQSSSCEHIQHFTCMKKWLATQTSCPLCRKKIDKILNNSNDWITLEEFRDDQFQNPENDEVAVQREEIQPRLENNGLQFPLLRQFTMPLFQIQLRTAFLWLIVQIEILVARFLIPQWGAIYPWAQAFQTVPPVLAFFLCDAVFPRRSTQIKGKLSLSAAVITIISAVFSYHSIFASVLSGFELGTVIAFFWLSLIFLGAFRYSFWTSTQIEAPLTRRATFFSALLWSAVEIEILLGKFFLPKWFNWFIWMQAFQIISFLLIFSSRIAPQRSNARTNIFYGTVVSLFTAAMSYASIIQAVLKAAVMVFWMFYPFVALVVLIPPLFFRSPSERIPPFCQCILYLFWTALETILLLAQNYSWCRCSLVSSLGWFMWMQGLQAISMFLLILVTVMRNSFAYGTVFFMLPLTAIITVASFI